MPQDLDCHIGGALGGVQLHARPGYATPKPPSPSFCENWPVAPRISSIRNTRRSHAAPPAPTAPGPRAQPGGAPADAPPELPVVRLTNPASGCGELVPLEDTSCSSSADPTCSRRGLSGRGCCCCCCLCCARGCSYPAFASLPGCPGPPGLWPPAATSSGGSSAGGGHTMRRQGREATLRDCTALHCTALHCKAPIGATGQEEGTQGSRLCVHTASTPCPKLEQQGGAHPDSGALLRSREIRQRRAEPRVCPGCAGRCDGGGSPGSGRDPTQPMATAEGARVGQ